MKYIYYFLCIFLFCQCSTLTKEQCEKGDWQNIGFVDGKKGRPQDYINHHEKVCPISSQEKDNYKKAHLLGLISFCTHQGGYLDGLDGLSFNNSCKGLNEKEFKNGYKKGRKLYLLKKRKSELTEKIAERKEEINKDESVLNHAVQAINLISGRSPTESLDREEQKISNEIYKEESTLPLDTPTSRYSTTQQADLMVNSLGAITGTVFGFGLGHAIQGRYRETGWKWTVADVTSISAIAITSSKYCNSETSYQGDNPTTTLNCKNNIPSYAILTYIGLRVWQSVNLWSNLNTSEYNQKYQVSVTPNGLYLIGQF